MEREIADHLVDRHLLQQHNRQIHQPVKAYVRRAPPVSAQIPASEMGATERARRSGTNSDDGTGALQPAGGAHHLRSLLHAPPRLAGGLHVRPSPRQLSSTSPPSTVQSFWGGAAARTWPRTRLLEDAAASSRPRGLAVTRTRPRPRPRPARPRGLAAARPRREGCGASPRTAERSADRGEDEDAAADRGAVRVSAEGLDGTGGRRPVRGYRGGLGMERP